MYKKLSLNFLYSVSLLSQKFSEISTHSLWSVYGYSLYGDVAYKVAARLVKCSGRHDYGYNDAKICIPAIPNKNGKFKEGYKILCDQVGPKPKGEISKLRPKGGPPCTKRILQELDLHSLVIRKELRDSLHSEGYQIKTIRNALISLKKQSKIITEGSPNSPKQIIKRTK